MIALTRLGEAVLNIAELSAVGLRRRHHVKTDELAGLLVRLVICLAIVAGVSLLCSASAKAQKLIQIAGADRTVMMTVPIGKSQDVRTDANFLDITVGDPDVADVNPLTDHTLSILGKKIGTTRVSVYGAGKKLVGIFDVEVSYDVSRLTNELKRRFPGSHISASSVNGRIMLSGEASDAAMLDSAVMIARQFGPEVINAVSVMSPQQVLLEVRFVEISRTAGRDLGFQWNGVSNKGVVNVGNRTPAANLPATSLPVAAAGVISGGSPFGFALARWALGGMTIDTAINALEEQGVARSLAEPNLVALSGDTASFLAGGEYPIPVAGSLGQITVEYKRYGVGLAFTPTVLSQGLINLKIEPEVSQIDPNQRIEIVNGISVPALIVRRASTTVELRDGQSFAIGGLLQNNSQNQVEQLPWVGSMPVLGALFTSKSYQKNETDLVIIVTPRLVRPARPGEVLRTPADKTVPPSDVDFFALSKNEVARAPKNGAQVQAVAAAAVTAPLSGHMLDISAR